MDPCIPAEWKEYEVARRFRGADYHIKVLNPDGVNKGVKSVTLNRTLLPGNVIPALKENEGKVNLVEVILGK
jgi:cellobiose phosphorylase